GGALMDLGCHGIAFCWWFLGKQKVKSVYAQLSTQVNKARTEGDDEAITIIEFADGSIGMVENSWNRPGGMDDTIEVFGDKGQTYADLLMGNALATYSEVGFGYAVEKAASTQGWTYPVFEEHWNYGFPQEMRHFARCVRGKETPASRSARARPTTTRSRTRSSACGRMVGSSPCAWSGIARGTAISPSPRARRDCVPARSPLSPTRRLRAAQGSAGRARS